MRAVARERSILSVGPLLFLCVLACTDPVSLEPPLSIATSTTILVVPRTVAFSTKGGPDGDTVSWESSDQSVATVSALGLVTAHFPGSSLIRVRRGSRSAAVTVTVTASRIDVGSSQVIVALGGTKTLTATVRDADGAEIGGVPVSWSTSDARVATVDRQTGVVSGLAPGNTTITASGGGTSGTTWASVETRLGAPLVFSTVQGSIGLHACGIEALTGLAYCWGDNELGALGSGQRDATPFPTLVNGARHFTSLSVGYYSTCAIEAQTQLAYCWGGLDDSTTRWEPTLVEGAIRFASISTSGGITCGVEAETGAGYCWSDPAWFHHERVFRYAPTAVGDRTIRFTSIAAGWDNACGLEAQTGQVYCWGFNVHGQIGDGTTVDRTSPTPVAGGRRFSSVDTDDRVTCGVEAETGLGYCWGQNDYGQVGDGTTNDRLVPTLVDSGRQRFTTVDTGYLTCGLEAETQAGYCWGLFTNPVTLLGDGTLRFSSINADNGRGCGVEAGTGVGYCWEHTLIPTPVPPPLATTTPDTPVPD